jgi:hypothetical protein
MTFSYLMEPRRRGLYEPFFWTHSTASRIPHPLVPLSFPEPLPTITLVDRNNLRVTKTENLGPTQNIVDASVIQRLDPRAAPDRRSRLPSPIPGKLPLAGMDIVGTVLRVDEELLVVVQASWDPSTATSASRPSSRAPSRPPSSMAEASGMERTIARKASMRIRPGSSRQSLERGASLSRRNSLPSLSARPTVTTAEPSASDKPLTVLVQAATLDRLIKLLVFGMEGRVTVAPSDDFGETPLRERTSRELRLDMDDFSATWWYSFRSFVTPLVFFEVCPFSHGISVHELRPHITVAT